MFCVKCGSTELRTIDTRPVKDNETRRRKKCLKCGYRFSTYEMTAERLIDKNNEFRNELKDVILASLSEAFTTPLSDMEIYGRDEYRDNQQSDKKMEELNHV